MSKHVKGIVATQSALRCIGLLLFLESDKILQSLLGGALIDKDSSATVGGIDRYGRFILSVSDFSTDPERECAINTTTIHMLRVTKAVSC